MKIITWLLGGELTGGSLHWDTDPILASIFAALALAALASSWLTARSSRSQALQLLLLIPAISLLYLALLRPSLVTETSTWEQGRFVILVDDSASMSVLEGSLPRNSEIPQVMAAIDQADAEIFTFGSELQPGIPTFDQDQSNLGIALQAARERFAGERLRGIALISDGIDRGGMRESWLLDSSVSDPTLPGPLTVYAIGQQAKLTDLSIEATELGGFAFIRTPLDLTVQLRGPGYEGRKVTVSLDEDGAFLQRKSVILDESGSAELTFTITPREVGRHTYEISVPVTAADAVPENNHHAVVVRVVRDRLRVLQVCGSPSMDEKFLRRFLKQDPSVDLVSFFILRTHKDLASGYQDDELTLIRFPYEQLFSTDLWSFDLVIFQNFDYAPYFGWLGKELLQNIVDYVREGGAFVMIGGDRSFDLGGYSETPLSDVLPVTLGVSGDPVDLSPVNGVLTSAGTRHPVTASVGSSFAELPAFDGINLSLGAATGAVSLLEHPSLKSPDGVALPLLAVRKVGLGRTMALMGDSSWRWAFSEAGKGRGNQAYLHFWKDSMRWLVGDPDAQRVQLTTSRENYLIGDNLKINVSVRDKGYLPLEGVDLRGRVTGPSFDKNSGAFEIKSGADGLASKLMKLTEPGPHTVQVSAYRGGSEFYSGETVFAVTARAPELEWIEPDPGFLQGLATAAGGRFWAASEPGQPIIDESAGHEVRETATRRLWDIPLIPILISLFATASWYVRRRGGAR